MNSAVGQNDCYLCYISAIWEGPLCVTAKLTKMVQYAFHHNNAPASHCSTSVFALTSTSVWGSIYSEAPFLAETPTINSKKYS